MCLGDERDRRRRAADVTTSLEALRHHSIRPGVFRPARLVGRSALPDDLDRGAMRQPNRLGVLACVAPEKGQNLDWGLHRRLDDSRSQERYQQVGS